MDCRFWTAPSEEGNVVRNLVFVSIPGRTNHYSYRVEGILYKQLPI